MINYEVIGSVSSEPVLIELSFNSSDFPVLVAFKNPSTEPLPTTFPCSTTITLSTSFKSDVLCVININVALGLYSLKFSINFFSVFASIELVGSSRIKMGASLLMRELLLTLASGHLKGPLLFHQVPV